MSFRNPASRARIAAMADEMAMERAIIADQASFRS
jgi:hypothetical protein